ncbi:hypothetical protein EXIGLDRAFT_847612, partial [Exidia glandulosa HHB12029]
MWPFSLLPIPPLPPLPPERTWYPHICKLDPYNPTIDKYWYLPHNGVSIDSAPSPVQGLAARLVMWLSAVLPVSRDTQSTLDRVVAWLVPSTVPRAATTYELDACMYVFKPAGPIYTHPTFLWIIQVALTIIALYYLLDVADKLCNVLVAFIAQSGEDKDATAPTRHIAPAVATATDHDASPPSSASPAQDSAPSLEQDSTPTLEQDSAPTLEQDSAPSPAQDHSPSPSPSPSPPPVLAQDILFTVPLQSQARKRRRSPSPDIQQSRHRSWFRSPPRSPSPSPSRSGSPIPALLPVSLYSSPGPSSPPSSIHSPAPRASLADLLTARDASSHAQTLPRSTTPTSTRSLSPPASLGGRLPLGARSLPRRSRSLDTIREVTHLSKPVTDTAWLRKALDLAVHPQTDGVQDRIIAREYETIVAQPALVEGNTEAFDGVEAPDAPPSQATAAPEANDGRDALPSIQTVDATTVPLPNSEDDDLEDVTTPSSALSALEPVTPSIVAPAPASNSSPVLLPADDGKLPSVTAIEQERAEAVQPTTVLVAIPPEPVVENSPIDDVSAPSALEPITPAASALIVSSSASNSLSSLPPTDDPPSGTTLQQGAKAVQSTAVLVAVVDPPAPVVENNPLVDPSTFYILDDGDADAASSSSRSGPKTLAPFENNPWIDPKTAWLNLDNDDPAPKPRARSMHQELPVVRRSQHQTLPGDPIPAPKPQGRWSKQEKSAQQLRKGPPTARGRGRGQQHVTPDRSTPPPVHQQQTPTKQPSLTPGAGPSTLSSPPPPPPHASGFAQGHTAHPNLPMPNGPVNQADHAGPSAKSKFDAARSRNSRRAQQPHHVSAFDTPETYTVPCTTSDLQAQTTKSRNRRAGQVENGKVKRRKAADGRMP